MWVFFRQKRFRSKSLVGIPEESSGSVADEKDRFPALVEQREEAQTQREGRKIKRAKDPPFRTK
jgi:hypothetical protein